MNLRSPVFFLGLISCFVLRKSRFLLTAVFGTSVLFMGRRRKLTAIGGPKSSRRTAVATRGIVVVLERLDGQFWESGSMRLFAHRSKQLKQLRIMLNAG
jgi:hypothetical protein